MGGPRRSSNTRGQPPRRLAAPQAGGSGAGTQAQPLPLSPRLPGWRRCPLRRACRRLSPRRSVFVMEARKLARAAESTLRPTMLQGAQGTAGEGRTISREASSVTDMQLRHRGATAAHFMVAQLGVQVGELCWSAFSCSCRPPLPAPLLT